MDCNNLCYIVFKYGGYWNAVKGQNRIKYVGGSKKTLKFKRGDINLFLLKERTEALCTWIRGHAYELHYHVNGTSPKIYMPILNDTDVIDMLTSSCDSNRVEVVIVVKDYEEYMGFTDDTQCSDMQNFSVNIRSNNDIIVDGLCEGSFAAQVEENNSLCVGSRFEDASSFKQAIRTNAILQNYAIKIKASDKSRVNAIYTYQGCPWRIRASVCSGGVSFEVRKINSTHLCPGVNRAGNKQASTSWIAYEIKDLMKRNPDIAPKDISNNLEPAFNVDIEHVAFISNMEKGLGEAIKLKLVWSAANCYNMHEFDSNLEQLLLISPQVHSYLTSLTCKWSKATFSKVVKNHNNTNNMAESFNSWIEEARSKLVVDLIDIIRGMLMEQRSYPPVPCVEEYIRDVTNRKEHFIIRRNKDRRKVDIESHMCTCGFWQLSGLPCVHAAAFVGMSHQNLWHKYIDEHYYSYRYKMAYEGAISTLSGKEQWSIPTDSIFVSPPISIRPQGRPKKRRIKNLLEGAKKSKTNHKCGRCNSWGHHRSTCKEPLSLDDENVRLVFFGHTNSQTYAT
ncbi:hypothetical protein KFK09_011287 [Dendrobium nobile]|uniref:SWIM-type domain-containing protein n=1 Tax=Dendrobium nobile TaxID=94219 RepID=A0A8T3BHV2_DENNO|nr:hypothetical protein KFK09_011287 [Dendrobium nobile]